MSREQPRSPSPIVDHLVRALAEVLPDDERPALTSFDGDVAATTSEGDLRRAWRCAEWAVQLAGRPDQSVLERRGHELQEAFRLLKDSMFGFAFGASFADGVGPAADVQLQWVDRAVAVAREAGAEVGWSQVPWQDLVRELTATGADDGR